MKVYGQLEKAQIEKRASAPTVAKTGEVVVDSSDSNQLKYADGTNSRTVVNTDQAQTLTNKTISGASNTITNVDASNVVNTPSGGVVATTAQAAINELDSDLTTHINDTSTHGVSGALVGTTDTQTLTNKTLTSPTANLIILEEQASTPATPAAGYKKLYPKTDGKLYTLDDAGNEIEVGSGGSGGGSRNYVDNGDFETGNDNVTVTSNITKALETSTPIDGSQSLKLTIGTSATTSDYADIDLSTFAKADTDESKNIIISFEYYNDANFSTDDVQFVLRNNTDSSDIIPLSDKNGINGKIQYSENTTKYVGYVQTKASVTDYSLRMNVLSAPATASNIVIDTVKVGPDSFTLATPNLEQNVDTVIVNSSGTITSQTSNIVSGVSNSGTGDWAVTFTGLTEAPVVISDTNDVSDRFSQVSDVTSTGARVITRSTSAREDRGFSLTVIKQGEDYVKGNVISTTDALIRSARARYNTDAGQNIPTASFTIVNFEDKDYDDLNAVTTGASWSYTSPVDQVVSVKAGIQFLSTVNWSTGNSILLQIYKNGTLYSQIDQLEVENSAGESLALGARGSDDVKLNAGDTIDIRVYQDTGSSLALNSNSTFNFISISPNPDLTSAGVYPDKDTITITSSSYTESNVKLERTINVDATTSTINLYPSAPVGTIRTIRKINATQGTITIQATGETFTSAGLSSVTLNANGDFWELEKVSATRWDLVEGYETGSNANGNYKKINTGVLIQNMEVSYDSSSVGSHLYTYPIAFDSLTDLSAYTAPSINNGGFPLYESMTIVDSTTQVNVRQFVAGSLTDEIKITATGRWY